MDSAFGLQASEEGSAVAVAELIVSIADGSGHWSILVVLFRDQQTID